MTVTPLGDSAVVIVCGEMIDRAVTQRIGALAQEFRRGNWPDLVDVVPAFSSLALFFLPGRVPDLPGFAGEVAAMLARMPEGTAPVGRCVEIPVCYGDADGPDLEEVAARAGLPPAEVVARHSAAEYFVHAIGFTPGFPYLGGLPPELATPRRASPRPRVAAGSVGIGGAQTGIYPQETPGGWNLIGRTLLTLFDSARAEPSLLRTGDTVKFQPIARAPFSPSIETASAALAPVVTDGIEVIRAGMQLTVQDLGRTGRRAEGVPLGGAADAFALRVANLLVGNVEDAAGLEFALVGPELKFARDAVVALGGAEFEGLPTWRPMQVTAGATLRVGAALRGCRGYLAVAGGIDVAPVLGSRSTYVRGGFGGWAGRELKAHDVVPIGAARRSLRGHWHVAPQILPVYSGDVQLRVVAGAQAGEFAPTWREASFTVSRQSDRMGIRLDGTALARLRSADLLSSPVAPGTVQVPPDGRPIILLADAQTIGGYPQLAHVATVDLPLAAQLRPGDTVRLREVSLAEARDLLAAREHSLALLREGLKDKWG